MLSDPETIIFFLKMASAAIGLIVAIIVAFILVVRHLFGFSYEFIRFWDYLKRRNKHR